MSVNISQGNLEFLDDPKYRYIDERGININDDKWAHPEIAPFHRAGGRKLAYDCTYPLFDPSTDEDRYNTVARMILGANGRKDERTYDNGVTLKAYYGHGCPEDPDVDVRVEVSYPKDYDPSVKHPVLFHPLGGSVYANFPGIYPIDKYCEEFDMPIVTPIHRSSLLAKYPAAINDMHAAYLWLVEHADEQGFDTDKVVIFGNSSGGHLGSSLAFRLKRYGWPGGMPRGVIAIQPQLTEITNYHCSQYRLDNFDAEANRWAAMTYLGIENYGNPNLGPEAYANRATVEDCKGLCPFFIHGGAMDPDVQAELEFVNKLIENDVYVQFMLWGGMGHASLHLASVAPIEGVDGSGIETSVAVGGGTRRLPEGGYSLIDRFIDERKGEVLDCVRYDFRRPWLMEA